MFKNQTKKITLLSFIFDNETNAKLDANLVFGTFLSPNSVLLMCIFLRFYERKTTKPII